MKVVRPGSRRRFLRGLGNATLALPFLPSLSTIFSRESLAAAAPGPNFVGVWIDNGRDVLAWYPLEGPGKLRQPTTLLGDGKTREMRLRDLPGSISNVLGTSLDPIRDKLLLLRNLNCYAPIGTHSHTLLLSGTGTKETYRTIDQVFASSKKIYPTAPRKNALGLMAVYDGQGLGDASNPKTISIDMVNGQPVRVLPLTQPRLAFEQMFQTGGNTGGATGPTIESKGNLTVVDRVFGDYSRLKSDCRLGAEDRQYLDAHVTFLHELHQRLLAEQSAPAATTACGPEAFAGRDWVGHRKTSDQVITDNIDVIVAALRCGYTRVATLALSPLGAGEKFGFPHKDGYHGNAHNAFASGDHLIRPNPVALAEYNEVSRYFARKNAELLIKMNEVVDPLSGRTLLDNSIVLYGSPLGHPNHQNEDLPILLAGSGGGRLATGRYIDYGGRNYNDLLVTLLQVMGLAPDDYEQGGVPGFGDYRSATQAADSRRTGLPFIRT
jgi:hypothetical protein